MSLFYNGIFACRSLWGGTVTNHVKFGVDLTMYTSVTSSWQLHQRHTHEDLTQVKVK